MARPTFAGVIVMILFGCRGGGPGGRSVAPDAASDAAGSGAAEGGLIDVAADGVAGERLGGDGRGDTSADLAPLADLPAAGEVAPQPAPPCPVPDPATQRCGRTTGSQCLTDDYLCRCDFPGQSNGEDGMWTCTHRRPMELVTSVTADLTIDCTPSAGAGTPAGTFTARFDNGRGRSPVSVGVTGYVLYFGGTYRASGSVQAPSTVQLAAGEARTATFSVNPAVVPAVRDGRGDLRRDVSLCTACATLDRLTAIPHVMGQRWEAEIRPAAIDCTR
jgi:hypothetical protein